MIMGIAMATGVTMVAGAMVIPTVIMAVRVLALGKAERTTTISRNCQNCVFCFVKINKVALM